MKGPRIVPVSYARGQQGSKLKWLPYRPSKPREPSRIATPQGKLRPVAVSLSEATRQSDVSPFDDPFADGSSKTQPAVAHESLGEEAINKLRATAALFQDESVPDFPAEEPSILSDQPAEDDEAYDTDDENRLRIPTIDETLAAAPPQLEGEDPTPLSDEYFTPIENLSTDISIEEDPDNVPRNHVISDATFDKTLRPSTWVPTTFTWKATGLCHKPLYFEEVHLERYGHSWGPYLQPIVSGGHFFLTVPVLPYLMGLNPPQECMYTLGYYRPGSCAPYLLDPIPLSIRAGLAQAGVWTGMSFLIP